MNGCLAAADGGWCGLPLGLLCDLDCLAASIAVLSTGGCPTRPGGPMALTNYLAHVSSICFSSPEQVSAHLAVSMRPFVLPSAF
jgi:hypothetical protein